MTAEFVRCGGCKDSRLITPRFAGGTATSSLSRFAESQPSGVTEVGCGRWAIPGSQLPTVG